MSKGASNLTLSQALNIRDNMYRSKDAQKDYEPEEIDERIHYLQSRQSERNLKASLKSLNDVPTIERFEDRLELVTEIRDYWKVYGPNGFSYELVEIPPQIMSF